MIRPASLYEQTEAVFAETGCVIKGAGCIANREKLVCANTGGIDATLAQKRTLSAPQRREDMIYGPQLAVQTNCLPDATCMPHSMCWAPASMKVTSEPRAVYTSENSSPIYPLPMMATHLGIQSNFRA